MELFSTEIEKSLDGLVFFFVVWGRAVQWISGEVETRNSVLEMLHLRYLLDTHIGRQLEIQVWIWKRHLG